jgi:hypothetical protein
MENSNSKLALKLRFVIVAMLMFSVLALAAGVMYEFNDIEPEPGIVALLSTALGTFATGLGLAIKSFFPDAKE